jgi:hypothetical protein
MFKVWIGQPISGVRTRRAKQCARLPTLHGDLVGRSPNLFQNASSVSRSTEVRWFIRGEGPPLPHCGRSFVDSYFAEMLAGCISAKSREGDAGGAFLKIRTAVHPPVDFGNMTGVPETWLRLEPERIPWNPRGERFDVRKEVFRHRGFELAHLEFDDEMWWSVAIRARKGSFPRLPRHITHHMNQSPMAVVSCSYPTWLLSLRPTPDHRLPLEVARANTRNT